MQFRRAVVGVLGEVFGWEYGGVFGGHAAAGWA